MALAEAAATAAAAAALTAVEEEKELKWQETLHYYSSTDWKEVIAKSKSIVETTMVMNNLAIPA